MFIKRNYVILFSFIRTSVRSLTTMRRTLHKSASAHGTVNGLQPEVEHAANPRKVINIKRLFAKLYMFIKGWQSYKTIGHKKRLNCLNFSVAYYFKLDSLLRCYDLNWIKTLQRVFWKELLCKNEQFYRCVSKKEFFLTDGIKHTRTKFFKSMGHYESLGVCLCQIK